MEKTVSKQDILEKWCGKVLYPNSGYVVGELYEGSTVPIYKAMDDYALEVTSRLRQLLKIYGYTEEKLNQIIDEE